jgi:hypothetical protein
MFRNFSWDWMERAWNRARVRPRMRQTVPRSWRREQGMLVLGPSERTSCAEGLFLDIRGMMMPIKPWAERTVNEGTRS